MKVHTLLSLIFKNSWVSWIVCGLFAVNLCSCERQNPIDNKEHQELINTIFNQADTIKYGQGVKRSIAFLDSAFNRVPDQQVLDLYRKYDFVLQMVTFDIVNYDMAQSYTDSIFALFKSDDNKAQYKRQYAMGYIWQGKINRAKRNYAKAYDSFNRGKVIAESTPDTCSYYPYNNQIANVYFDQADYEQAGRYYMMAYENTTHCGNGSTFNEIFVERQGNLSNVGICYSRQGKLDSALYFFDQALKFIETNEKRFPLQKDFMYIARAVIYNHKTDVFIKQKKYELAEKTLRMSIAANSSRGHDEQLAQICLAKLIEILLLTNQVAAAQVNLAALETSLDTLPSTGSKLSWYRSQAIYFKKIGEFQKSNHFGERYIIYKDSLEQSYVKQVGFDQVLAGMASENKLAQVAQQNRLRSLYLTGAITLVVLVSVIAFLIWRNSKRTEQNVLNLQFLNDQIVGQNNAMKVTLDALESSNAENSRLTKIVAHDLRNPIGAISMATSLLLTEKDYNDEQLDYLNMIKDSTTDSLALIDTLLQNSKNQTKMKKEWVEIHMLLLHCVNMLKYKAAEKNQQIELNTEPVKLYLDSDKMWRAITNLIGNAIKFSPEGEVIKVVVSLTSQTVLIAVIDHGIGIPLPLQDKIFDFYNVSEIKREGTAGEESFGLGLAISQKIVEDNDGKIWFKSEPGKGTTFFVEFVRPNTQDL